MSASTTTGALTTEDCRYCWMCRHVCPVGHVTKRETLTPHAWALLIASVERGTLAGTPRRRRALQCADCGMCRAHCITDRPLPEAIALARAAGGRGGQRARAPPTSCATPSNRALSAAPAAPAPAAATSPSLSAQRWRWRRRGSIDAAMTAARAGGRPRHANRPGPRQRRRRQRARLSRRRRAGRPRPCSPTWRRAGPARAGTVAPRTATRSSASTMSGSGSSGPEQVERRRRDRRCWPRRWPMGAWRCGAATDAPAYAYHDPCHAPRIDRDGGARAPCSRRPRRGRAPAVLARAARAHPCGAVGGLDVTQPRALAGAAGRRPARRRAGRSVPTVAGHRRRPAASRHLKTRSTPSVTDVRILRTARGRSSLHVETGELS